MPWIHPQLDWEGQACIAGNTKLWLKSNVMFHAGSKNLVRQVGFRRILPTFEVFATGALNLKPCLIEELGDLANPYISIRLYT